MMRLRRLGRFGLAISELSLGTAGWERPGLAADEAGAAMRRALGGGINAVEISADADRAIEILADVLKETSARQDIHILARLTSLVPFDLPSPHVHAQQAYPGQHIRAQTEAVLRRLGVERLGVQQLHAWCPEWLHEGDWLETLVRLREEGKIAGIGVSLFDHDVEAALEAVGSGVVDCVQVMYNIFDRGAAAALLPFCRSRDVGVIARSPLYYGALAETVSAPEPFAAGDWRSDYFYDAHLRETRARVDRLRAEVQPPDGPIAETAIRFSLSHAAVSTVAVGMRTRDQVEANLRAVERGPLSVERLKALRRHKWLC
jgi:aryl-alcohol dehydrogenase-like predicted oxidoreductase